MKNIKVLMLGDGGVGKTSLSKRFVHDSFKGRYKATIGVEIMQKTIEDLNMHLQIWDLAGQAHFQKIREKFYRGSSSGLLLFDLTNRTSFDNLDTWIAEVQKNAGDVPLYLVGNKADLDDLITVQKEEVQAYTETRAIPYVYTSAKTGENVVDAFRSLVREVERRNDSD